MFGNYMKSQFLMLLVWVVGPVLCSAGPVALPLLNSTLPSESKVTVISNDKEFSIVVKTPDSHYPFWQSHPTVRISYSTHLPTFSLIANIGKPDEFRLVFRPKNVGRHFDAPPEELPLEVDGVDLGRVVLYTQKGAIDTHRARYVVKSTVLERLGSSFALVSGNPFTQHIETEMPNKTVDSTATRVTPPADPSLRSGQESRHGQP